MMKISNSNFNLIFKFYINLQSLTLVCLVIFFNLSANAIDETRDVVKTVDRPEINALKSSESQVDDNFSWSAIGGYKIENGMFQVEIRGELIKGKFNLNKTKLFLKNNDKLKEIPSSTLFNAYEFELLKEDEKFTLLVKLPKGIFEMQLEAKVDGRIQKYEFQIETNDKWPLPPPPAASMYLCNQCMTLQTGFNYIAFKNSVNSEIGQMEYSSFYIPSLQFKFRKKIKRKIGLRLDFSSNKGNNLKTIKYNLGSNSVLPSTLLLGGDFITQPNGKILSTSYSSGYLLSLNQYKLPVIEYGASQNSLSIKNDQILALSAGGFFALRFWNSEFITNMNFQLPTSFNGLSFDGSLTFLTSLNSGLLPETNSNKSSSLNSKPKSTTNSKPNSNFNSIDSNELYWGVSWNGQFHTYNRKISTEKGSGPYSFFISKIEALLVYLF